MLKAHTELSKLLLIPEGPGSPRETGVRVKWRAVGVCLLLFVCFFPGISYTGVPRHW